MNNREIKFRFWDKNSKWEKDFGVYADGIIGDFSECFHNTAGKNGEHYVAQQFTGLLDKNGQEIYEGDIISCEERMMDGMPDFKRPIAVVIWDGCCWCYSLDKERGWKNPHQILRFAKNIEVIGNIFENPELLQC